MARTRSIIKQEINGYVEDIYNEALEYIDDEIKAMALARSIAESTKDYTLDVVWEVSENMEMEIVKELGRRPNPSKKELVSIIKKVFRYWQR